MTAFSNRPIIEYRGPQGSVVDPLLFNNNGIDILWYYEGSEIKNYADDKNHYSSATDIPTVDSEF